MSTIEGELSRAINALREAWRILDEERRLGIDYSDAIDHVDSALAALEHDADLGFVRWPVAGGNDT